MAYTELKSGTTATNVTFSGLGIVSCTGLTLETEKAPIEIFTATAGYATGDEATDSKWSPLTADGNIVQFSKRTQSIRLVEANRYRIKAPATAQTCKIGYN